VIRSASALIIYNKKVLLLHRDNIPTISNPNMWGSIGGGVEVGETFDEGIKREIEEETNLKPRNIRLLGKISLPDQETCVYTIKLESDELVDIKLGNEGQELKFFSFEEVGSLPIGENIKHYLAKFETAIRRLIEGENVPASDLGLS
jgi:ADP-ribose pyrophosphatase YjhB (NUDIX family)